MATGKTWYNKIGYKSKYYTQEVAHNKKIIQLPFVKFITDIAAEVDYKQEHPSQPSLESLLEGRHFIMQKHNPTVKELFTAVSRLLRVKDLECDAGYPEIEWILDVLHFIDVCGASQTSIENADPKNIIHVRNTEIPQIKTL